MHLNRYHAWTGRKRIGARCLRFFGAARVMARHVDALSEIEQRRGRVGDRRRRGGLLRERLDMIHGEESSLVEDPDAPCDDVRRA